MLIITDGIVPIRKQCREHLNSKLTLGIAPHSPLHVIRRILTIRERICVFPRDRRRGETIANCLGVYHDQPSGYDPTNCLCSTLLCQTDLRVA